MSSASATPADTRRGERGSIMVMTAVLMVGLVLAVGLCIDVARIYLLRAELQNAADAAALAGARELNSGITGINDAATQATAIVNTQSYGGGASVAIAKVEFANNLNNEAYTSRADFDAMSFGEKQAFAQGVRFVRVTTQPGSINTLFAGSVLGPVHNEARTATAGMSVGINTICDFFPAAVALEDPDSLTPGTPMTLKFVQGTGGLATLEDKNYIILLDVPDINGNDAPEIEVLSAGVTNICRSVGGAVNFHVTSGPDGPPDPLEEGVNTRFIAASADFPPDTNVSPAINYTLYKSVKPDGASGMDGRRILIMPIIRPVTNQSGAPIVRFAAFFLRQRLTAVEPCSDPGNVCAEMLVEYTEDNITVGRGNYDPAGASSKFAIPVLYQ